MPRTVTITIPDGENAGDTLRHVARLLDQDYREGYGPRWTIEGDEEDDEGPECDECGATFPDGDDGPGDGHEPSCSLYDNGLDECPECRSQDCPRATDDDATCWDFDDDEEE